MIRSLFSKLSGAKKGQFYILIALLLISYAFTLTRQDVPTQKPSDSFRLLHEGYSSEGTHIINNAVYEDANITARFANFTNGYLAFARSSEPSFTLAYLLRVGDQLTVGNRLDAALNVTLGNGASYVIGQGAEQTFSASGATLLAHGAQYVFRFSDGDIQLKALFRKADKLSTSIFVRG